MPDYRKVPKNSTPSNNQGKTLLVLRAHTRGVLRRDECYGAKPLGAVVPQASQAALFSPEKQRLVTHHDKEIQKY